MSIERFKRPQVLRLWAVLQALVIPVALGLALLIDRNVPGTRDYFVKAAQGDMASVTIVAAIVLLCALFILSSVGLWMIRRWGVIFAALPWGIVAAFTSITFLSEVLGGRNRSLFLVDLWLAIWPPLMWLYFFLLFRRLANSGALK